MSSLKQSIISRIEALLKPAKPILWVHLIQDANNPELFWHKGKAYTRETARQLPARGRTFIVRARSQRKSIVENSPV